MTDHIKKHDDAKAEKELEALRKEIADRRIASAASGAALIEKARRQAEIIEKDDLEGRMGALEEGTSAGLDAATSDALRSLYEGEAAPPDDHS
ncbi:MAG: hypothetical protein KGI69_02060 [Patescibacteria group bacterium]|nr:hypothetical protein [Patescibacteria group bacterium]